MGFEEWLNDYENKHEAYADVIAKDAWDYKQAEIDAALKQRDSFIKAHHIAMNDVCDQKAEIDALQKRIDDSIALLQGKSIGEVYKAIRILKGDKND